MKVSVLMLTYNHSQFIAQAIESIICQKTNFEFEIVIGDDCSKDNSQDIIREYALKYPNYIKTILREQNIGMMNNFIDVLSQCKGKYIAICEGDDYWTNDSKLQIQADYLDRNNAVNVCFHNAIITYDDGSFPDHTFYSNNPIYPNNIKHPNEITTLDDIVLGNYIQTCTCMFRNGAIKEFPKWFTEQTLGDWTLHILNSITGNLGYIENVMAVYRVHSGGVWSTKNDKNKIENTIQILEILNEHFEKKYESKIVQKIKDLYTSLARVFIVDTNKYLQDSDFESALDSSLEAINVLSKINSSRQGLYLIQAVCQANLGYLDEALESVTNEMILFPDNEEAYELQEKISELLEKQNVNLSYSKYKKESESGKFDFDVSIIIPVYNNCTLTSQCINAIIDNSGTEVNYEIIIVDNASTDLTKQIITDLQIEYNNLVYFENKENLGFAKACNQGIANRKGKHVLLLNNDTVPHAGWLKGIMEEMITDRAVGAVGACLLYPDTDLIQHIWVNIGTEDGSTLAPYHPYRLKPISQTEEAMLSRYVSAVTGACILINNEAINKVGLLDEEYINGLEDIDYCFRLTQAGFKIKYSANSIVYHYESMTPNRHNKDVINWQRLNRKWLGVVAFDETSEQTNQEVKAINQRQKDIDNGVETNYNQLLDKNEIENNEIDFSIIIPAHNNLSFTRSCINSILKSDSSINYEIIVINNASTDRTEEYLNSLDDKVIAINNDNNETFSKVNNEGAKIAKGKYLVFMNNDVEIFANALNNLKIAFENDSNIGIQGAKLLYPDESIQHAGVVYGKIKPNLNAHFHLHLLHNRNADYVNKFRDFQMVTGAFLTIRKEVFNQIEGFDENYIFGHEDLDISLKVKHSGFRVVYNPEVEAFHYDSQTKKIKGLEKFERYTDNPDNYDNRNEIYFQSKWKDKIILDADNYFEEDGFLGLITNKDISKEFLDKVAFLNTTIKFIHTQKRQDLVDDLNRILFEKLPLDIIDDPLHIIRANIKNVIKAEEYIQNIINPKKAFEKSEDKKKILITMYGWNESGGGTTFPKSLSTELVNKGYEIFVLFAAGNHSSISTPYYLEQSIENGLNLFGIYNRSTNFLDADNPSREIADADILRIFESVINKINPDLVHYNNFLGLSFAIGDIVTKYNIPSIYTPHNYHLIDPKLYMINDNFQKWTGTDFEKNSELIKQRPDLKEQYILRTKKALELINDKIDVTIAVSSRQKELLIEFGANPDKIAVVNQIPLLPNYNSNISESNNPIKFGFIGGVMPHKGVHILLLAAQEFEENEAEIHIFGFVTNGYQSILNSIETKCKVFFHGEYKNSDLNEISEQIDLVVIPSIWEDCAPLVLAECLNYGLPIIGAKIGGIPDFVKDDFNGLLYAYNSPIDLALKMKKVIYDKELLQKWKNNCKTFYNFNDYVEHISYIYISLINNEKKSISNFELKFFEPNKNVVKKELNDTPTKQSKIENNNIGKNMFNEMNRLKLEQDLPYGFANSDASGKLPSILPSPLKLNLGCGKDVKDDFLNFDLYSNNPKVIAMDIRKLDIASNSADYILASDILEHFSHREVDAVLKEWARVLKPGGTIEIRCPSLKLQLQAYMRGDWNANIASYMIFGGQTNPGDYHCVGFDEHSIRLHLSLAGLEMYDYKEFDFPQEHGYINLNMTVLARKLSLEGVDYDEIKNSQTRQEPIDSSVYGGGSDFDLDAMDQIEQNFEVNIPKYEIKWSPSENYNPQLNIVWEGSQFVFHSLALVNREHCTNILEAAQANLTIVPYENDQFQPDGNKKYEALFANDIRNKEETPQDIAQKPYVWIRHQWPPKDDAPLGAKWIIMQPWEFTQLRKDFVEIFNEADEIWTPSNFCRNVYIESGVEFDKVQVIPNGVDPILFTPKGKEYVLKSKKKLKFLFVGGTIARKGIDILLAAYLNAFTAQDNVCLVIKDLGGESFYRGQTAQQMIAQAQKTENAPEIEYIDEKLSEQDIANLYRVCDLFISPYRGEGFSLPTLEAMASGLPVVVTRGGATDDYVDESIGWQIPSEMSSIGSNIDGKELTGEAFFLEPNEESLTQILRDIYNNPTTLLPIGLLASLRARTKWTWKLSTLKLLTRLDVLYGTSMSKIANESFIDEDDSFIILGLAEKTYIDGDNELAKEYFHKAIEMGLSNSKYNIYAHHSIAMILIEEDNLEEAEQILQTASMIIPNHIDTQYLKVKIYSLNGRITEALEIITPILDTWSEDKFQSSISLTLDHLLSYTGDLLYSMGDSEGALKIYSACLQINKENTDALFGSGLTLRDLGKYEDAKIMFEKVTYYNPSNEDAAIELKNLKLF